MGASEKIDTFNLESRKATMPVDRHRARRLAEESPFLLLKHPIFIPMMMIYTHTDSKLYNHYL